MEKMIRESDGALMEITVIDELVSDYADGQHVDLDDLLALTKRAADHVKNLRAAIKKEILK